MVTTDRGSGDHEAPSPMLTVAAVARRLGVAPSTLRTWDRRYDLGPSAHTAGSHRRYAPQDLQRLVVMRRLTLDGVPPAEAARIALTSPIDPTGTDAPTGTGETGETSDDRTGTGPQEGEHPMAPTSAQAGSTAPDGRLATPSDPAEHRRAPAIPAARTRRTVELDPASWHRDSTHRDSLSSWPLTDGAPHPAASSAQEEPGRAVPRNGGGRVVALPDGSPAARGLARAAMSLDSGEVQRLFEDSVKAYGVRAAWDTMAMPVLQSIGERWRVTGDGVDVEHAFSEAVVAVLHGVTGALRRPRNARPVMLTCAEGDYHTLPLHALAAALAEQGVGVRLLGVGMPAAALVAAVRRTGPATVFLYARLPVVDVGVLELLPRQRPAPRLVVGGPGWNDRELPPQVAVSASLDDAVERVLESIDP